MASHKGLIVLVTTAGVLTLGIVLGVLFLFPKSPGAEVAANIGEPSVFTLSVETVDESETTDMEDPAATPEALEVTPSTGLLPKPSSETAPPSPVPTAPAASNSSSPEWTRTTAPTVTVTTQTAAPAAPATRTTAVSPARTPAPAPVVSGPQYWIQIGAFHSHTQAESVAQRLSARGMNGVITTVQSGSNLMYRVRLGPWANKADADAFLTRVKSVDGYEASYVVRTG